VALHQRDVRPSGFVRGLTLPPGLALGSPVKTNPFSFDRLVVVAQVEVENLGVNVTPTAN
jgi:hypothetical protein